MNSWATIAVYIVASAFSGALLTLAVMAIIRRRSEARYKANSVLEGVRWERNEKELSYAALRHLRRHYPTHDLMTEIRFLDLVIPKGHGGSQVVDRCKNWTVAIVMIDKRNGHLGRVVLLSTDEDAEEKSWILRRTGYDVVVIEPDGLESEVIERMKKAA